MAYLRFKRLLAGKNLQPKSCTSENEKDNFLFYIKVLYKKQKECSFTDEVKRFFHFLCPPGLAILPNLLCYQWLEVYKYVSAIDASHLQ